MRHRETKRKAKQYGTQASQVAEAAKLQDAECKEREEALQALRRMREILKKVDTKRAVEQIREDRHAR